MVDRPGRVKRLRDFFCQLRLGAVLHRSGRQDLFRAVGGSEPLRILIAHITGRIVIHDQHDDAGDVLVAADQMLRLPPVGFSLFRTVEAGLELLEVRQSE